MARIRSSNSSCDSRRPPVGTAAGAAAVGEARFIARSPCRRRRPPSPPPRPPRARASRPAGWDWRSDEHTSELQSLMRISYAVFCLKKKKINISHSEKINLIIIRTTRHVMSGKLQSYKELDNTHI